MPSDAPPYPHHDPIASILAADYSDHWSPPVLVARCDADFCWRVGPLTRCAVRTPNTNLIFIN